MYKKGDIFNIKNYCLIRQVSKYIERIHKTELVNYFENNNLPSCTRFDLRTDKSTEQAIAIAIATC